MLDLNKAVTSVCRFLHLCLNIQINGEKTLMEKHIEGEQNHVKLKRLVGIEKQPETAAKQSYHT